MALSRFAETTEFDLSKFQRHVQLYNRFRCLDSTAENLTDTEDDATIPRAFKTTNKNIDHGSGQQKQRSKLEKSKGHTSLDKQVAAFESIKKDDPFSTANTPQKVDTIFDLHQPGKQDHRDLYYFNARCRNEQQYQF
ncbi:hypothetical protein G6F42_014697 [Rhizopus arrhizus]|nr:hypothetical protein G6F42_014697 [Rhizopus arrhizus]